MRIVIDLQACQNGSRHRGIGRYAMAVSRAMIVAAPEHRFNILLSDAFPGTIRPIRQAFADVLPQEHIHVWSAPGGAASANPANSWRTRAAEVVRAHAIEALAPDLLFVPSLFEGYHDAMVTSVEPNAAYRTAMTLFDFIPIEYPREYLPDAAILAAYHRKLAHARAADVLLPISHYVAEQAERRLGDGGARIVAVPLGVEAMFRVPQDGTVDRAALMARYGIARLFVLNTSPLEYRKNIPGLIAGFATLPRSLRDAHQLVIVGRMDDKARRRIARMVADARLPADAVVLAGFVPDEDLVALYATCELFAFPSISEGFGLPVLEAMACGAAVVGSATTSVPEVIGRADLMFDPLDPPAIGAAMARVLGDPGLRDELRRFGPERAAGFTWEAAARTMLEAFAALPPATAVSPPVAAPSPGRAVVVPAIDADLADFLVALLPQFGAASDVTLVCATGVADVRLSALYDIRDFAWFARHGAGIGAALYIPGGDGLGDLMALHPGVLIAPATTADGDAPRAYAIETMYAPALLRPLAPAMGPSIVAALDRCAATRRHDPLRSLAERLPRAVRDVRPSSTDLVRVARAVGANEAAWRAPATFLLIDSASADDNVVRALRTRLPSLRLVFTRDLAWIAADSPGSGEPIPMRAGDRLLWIVGLGGMECDPTKALDRANELGVTIHIVIASPNSAGQPQLMIDWLETTKSGAASTVTAVGIEAAVDITPRLQSTLSSISDAGIPLNIFTGGKPAAIERFFPGIQVIDPKAGRS